jgi:hypothetical protein
MIPNGGDSSALMLILLAITSLLLMATTASHDCLLTGWLSLSMSITKLPGWCLMLQNGSHRKYHFKQFRHCCVTCSLSRKLVCWATAWQQPSLLALLFSFSGVISHYVSQRQQNPKQAVLLKPASKHEWLNDDLAASSRQACLISCIMIDGHEINK